MQEFLSIALLMMLAAISPGPDFAVVTKNSLMHSRRAKLYSALRVSASMLTHRLVSQYLYAMQFYIIKTMGALLVALGVRIATLNQAILP